MPQLPALLQVRAQSTPALLGSLVTVAVKLSVALTNKEYVAGVAGHVAVKLTQRSDGGGGGGFCTLKVLPPLQPVSASIVAATRERSIHRSVAIANLFESCFIIDFDGSRSRPCASALGQQSVAWGANYCPVQRKCTV